ncbi:MAG: thiamine-phosphate kinase [Chthoniobacterales bacterium]
MTEESLLALFKNELPSPDESVALGIGDDCAVVKFLKNSLVLKTDATIEEIHFKKNDHLSDVGWKALCRPISDFAAMGATPQHALISVAAPSLWTKKEWQQLYKGISKAAKKFGIVIVGGETSRSPKGLFLSVMLSGAAPHRLLLRSQAEPSDVICVTGKLGGSLKSGRHLNFIPRLTEGQWLATQPAVHAMMDLSDGLGSDLPRFATASGCAFELDKKSLPLHTTCSIEEAISDGEDYELLFSVAPHKLPPLQRNWKKKFPKLRLTCIGTMLAKNQPSTELPRGYDCLEHSLRSPKKLNDDGS